ncbi:MAG: nucleotidyltransferase family protein [Thermoleophilia bacterium]
MPVRSSDSFVLRWPARDEVLTAARAWAAEVGRSRAEVASIGVFGSYARDDWGVGSDLDLVAILDAATEPFERRALSFDLLDLPVPAELLVYTSAEWEVLLDKGGRFARVVTAEAIWIYERDR